MKFKRPKIIFKNSKKVIDKVSWVCYDKQAVKKKAVKNARISGTKSA